MLKIRKNIESFIYIFIMLFTIFLALTRILGFIPYTVLTGSMEPKYPVGSFVYVKKVDFNQLNVGDDITFFINNKQAIVTHKVDSVDKSSKTIITKGIANEVVDATPVKNDNIIGKVYFCIPYMGFVSNFIIKSKVIYLILIYFVIYLIYIVLRKGK